MSDSKKDPTEPVEHTPGQIIATFSAGWSPQMVVKSKGITPKSL